MASVSRKQLTCRGVALVTLAVIALASSARAERRILLQSYSGQAPQDALDYVSYLVRTLGSDAPLSGAMLAKLIDARISTYSGDGSKSEAIAQRVERGRRQFIEGEYERAIPLLSAVRDELLANQRLLGADQTLRRPLHRATLFLAHAYLRTQQNTRAIALLGKVLRSFPDQELSPVHHGPDLVQLYRTVRRELSRERRGALTVVSDPASCMVFLNERYVGLSPTTISNLYPGDYRLYLQRPGRPGRTHDVRITGAARRIAVDFTFDSLLKTKPFVGLLYSSRDTLRQRASNDAIRVARAVEAKQVLVISIQRHQGQRHLRGTVLSAATGRPIRSGMLAIGPSAPAPAELKAFGRFLMLGRPGPGVVVEADKPTASITGLWRWIALGSGIATLAAGIPLLAIHGKGACPHNVNCPESYNTFAPGLALTIAGAAALTTSVALFILHARWTRHDAVSSVMATPWVALTSGGISATVSF